MKKLTFLLVLTSPLAALGQFTTVTAQIADPNGVLFQNCIVSASFIGQSSLPGPYLLAGSVFQLNLAGARCDSFANISFSLADNNIVAPSPSQWKIDFCDQTGKYCGEALLTITGTSMNISAQLKAVAPTLPTPGGGSGVTSVGGTANQICVNNPTTTPGVSICSNPTLPGNVIVSGTLNINGASFAAFSKTITAIGGNSGTLAQQGTVSGTALSCFDVNGNITNVGCPPAGGVPGSPNFAIQYNNSAAFGGDSTFTFNPTTHTQIVQNQVINGTQTFSQPWGLSTSIPLTPACTSALAGTSQFCINSDGQFAVQINGGPLADLATIGGLGVVTNPTASQNVVQPGGTTLSTNSLSNIVYVTASYNWSQSPSGSIAIGANTVTLSPCPPGIMVTYGFTSTPWTKVLVSGTPGAAETPTITATTCTQAGGSSGTITFTAANAHNAGFTVASASQGFQEAVNASMQTVVDSTIVQQGHVVFPPGEYTWKGRATVMSTGVLIDASGAVINCPMSDDCLFIGDPNGSSRVKNVTISKLTMRPGVAAGNFIAVEVNAQNTHIFDYAMQRTNASACATCSFGTALQVDDDQAFRLDGMTVSADGVWSHCGTDFCTTAIKTGSGSAVGQLSHLSFNLNCTGNGVDWQSGNTLRVSDSIIQAQGQFGIRSKGTFSNVPNLELDNVYMEVSGCANTNPLGVGTAGLIVENGFAAVKSSVGPTGATQLYANTGATQFNYYVVAHTSSGNLVSAPFLAGTALSNQSGSIVVKWPQIGSTGTITYDVIRTSGGANAPAPYTAVCGGTTITACGSVAVGLTTAGACSTVGAAHICSFTDTASANTTAYTVTTPPTFWPSFGDGSGAGVFWPGAVVYTSDTDQVNVSPTQSGVHFDRVGDNVANSNTNPVNQMVSSFGPLIPKFFSQQCVNITGGVWISCGEIAIGTTPGAMLLQSGAYNAADVAGLKGRLIFEQGLFGSVNGGHKITLVDSNPAKTLNTSGLRPTNDANDCYLGLDNTSSVAPSLAQLAIGCPVSISYYIGNAGDNSSWLEKLTSTLKTFTVPVTLSGAGTNLTVGGTLTQTGAATFNSTAQFSAAVTVNAAETVNGNLTAYRPVLAKTSNFTIGQAQSGAFFNNNGAAGEVDFTLPSCSTNGVNYAFYIDAVQVLKVIAVGGAKIRNLATLGTANGNIQASTQGNAVHIQCIGTSGADGVAEWVVDTISGTWSVN